MAFRLLDLAAELRDQIYEKALIHDREKKKIASIALLRTCKQVHKEAEGIFAKNSTFSIRVNIDYLPSRVLTNQVTINGEKVVYLNDAKPSVVKVFEALNNDIVRAAKVRFSFHCKKRHDKDVWWEDSRALPFVLYAFATFMNTTTTEHKSIEIHAGKTLRKIIKPDRAAKMFWPVQKFHPRFDIELTGFDHGVVDHLRPALRGRSEYFATDMISLHRPLSKKMRMVKKLFNEALKAGDSSIDRLDNLLIRVANDYLDEAWAWYVDDGSLFALVPTITDERMMYMRWIAAKIAADILGAQLASDRKGGMPTIEEDRKVFLKRLHHAVSPHWEKEELRKMVMEGPRNVAWIQKIVRAVQDCEAKNLSSRKEVGNVDA